MAKPQQADCHLLISRVNNDRVMILQQRRQKEIECAEIAFFDRSPIDVLSYGLMFGPAPSLSILQGVEQAIRYYNKTVFLLENLGFCIQTEVRAETNEESLFIEQTIEKNYRDFGFEVVRVPVGTIEERARWISETISQEGFLAFRRS